MHGWFYGNYWKEALSKAEDLASPIEVSLACLEDCFPSLQEKLINEGVAIVISRVGYLTLKARVDEE